MTNPKYRGPTVATRPGSAAATSRSTTSAAGSDPSAASAERLVELDPTRRRLDREVTDPEAVVSRDLRGAGEDGRQIGLHRSTVLQWPLTRTALPRWRIRRFWPIGQEAAARVWHRKHAFERGHVKAKQAHPMDGADLDRPIMTRAIEVVGPGPVRPATPDEHRSVALDHQGSTISKSFVSPSTISPVSGTSFRTMGWRPRSWSSHTIMPSAPLVRSSRLRMRSMTSPARLRSVSGRCRAF